MKKIIVLIIVVVFLLMIGFVFIFGIVVNVVNLLESSLIYKDVCSGFYFVGYENV